MSSKIIKGSLSVLGGAFLGGQVAAAGNPVVDDVPCFDNLRDYSIAALGVAPDIKGYGVMNKTADYTVFMDSRQTDGGLRGRFHYQVVSLATAQKCDFQQDIILREGGVRTLSVAGVCAPLNGWRDQSELEDVRGRYQPRAGIYDENTPFMRYARDQCWAIGGGTDDRGEYRREIDKEAHIVAESSCIPLTENAGVCVTESFKGSVYDGRTNDVELSFQHSYICNGQAYTTEARYNREPTPYEGARYNEKSAKKTEVLRYDP
ncbi:MAG: hypothetical protein H6868_08085 [Rhodospirillales bacterium]|nr:hypothetical protein [Rhodospirillales bacterium]